MISALQSMVERDRWCISNGPRGDKRPRQIDGTPASVTDPSTWASFAEASAAARDRGWNVGYMFGDGVHFFVDLDNKDPRVTTHPWLDRFAGAATERSLGGYGWHIYGTISDSVIPEHSCKRKDHTEFYTADRYGIVTGIDLQGSSSSAHEIGPFVREFFPPRESTAADWTDEPCDEYTGTWDDDELIERMLASSGSAAAAFGGRATPAELWSASDRLAEYYPPPMDDAFDRSSADVALAGLLAFWTGKDCERIERLMWRSELVRDKWEDREDYLKRTILQAVSACRSVYDRVPQSVPEDSLVETAKLLDGAVYIYSLDRMLMPGGELLKRDQVNNLYADRGPYPLPGGDSTWKAWESTLRRRPALPRAYGVTFDPSTTDTIVVGSDGHLRANTWRGIRTPKVPGDVSVFLDHVRSIYTATDSEVVLAYLAAIVQYPGRKFPWLLVQQGVEGNGKSTITSALARLLGTEYVAMPRPSQIGSRFNASLSGKILAIIDDVDRLSPKTMEAMKTIITSSRVEIERKGSDSVVEDTCVNFVANTNSIDAVPKSRNDRRIAIVVSTQQKVEDLPDRHYFDRLHASLRCLAPLHHWLAVYQIPEYLDPTKGARRAPYTDGQELAIAYGRPLLEQCILDAIESDRYRFRGGWVSRSGIDEICKDLRIDASPQDKRRAVEAIGYVPHRGGDESRASRLVPIDGIRSRLWVSPDTPQDKREIEDYETAQASAGTSHQSEKKRNGDQQTAIPGEFPAAKNPGGLH